MTNKELLKAYFIKNVKRQDGLPINHPGPNGNGIIDYMMLLADLVEDEDLPEVIFRMFDELIVEDPADSREFLIIKDDLRSLFKGQPILN